MAESELRALVVGTGFGCRIQVPALRGAGFDVVGLVGSDAGRTAERAAANGVAQAYTDLDKAIAETNRELAASRVDLSIRAAGDKLILAIGKAQPGAPHMEATVWIASVERSVTVEIKRGENRGRSVTYYNVVRRLSPIGMWDGKAMTVKLASRDIMRTANERCIVLLQKGESGPILAAAELKP